MNKMNKMNQGYLELIIGPMFSGKTSRLIEIYNQCIADNINVIVVNFIGDKRYHKTMLSSHDEIVVPCEFTQSLRDFLDGDYMQNADVILINEGQFFDDLYESVRTMIDELHKKVYVCGLDGDYRREKIGYILDLIPICDKLEKLTSKCSVCNEVALFSHRTVKQREQYVIGANDSYMPLCRACYLQRNEKVAGIYYTEDSSKTI